MRMYPLIALQGLWGDLDSGSIITVEGDKAQLNQSEAKQDLSVVERREADGHLDPGRYVRRGDMIPIHVRRRGSGEVYADVETWAQSTAYEKEAPWLRNDPAAVRSAQCKLCLLWSRVENRFARKSFEFGDVGAKCLNLTTWERPGRWEGRIEYLMRADDYIRKATNEYIGGMVVGKVG